jgi:hypothetical protein
VLAAAAIEFALTDMFPSAPDVPETRLNRDPVASVNTLASIPAAEELIAAASPARVLSEEFSVIVSGVPLVPSWCPHLH